ncbi:MAG: hypothetical protein ACXAC7_18105 [Candidatus Hodarchaeales archaeon]
MSVASSPPPQSSAYRVKFRRQEFLELLSIAKPPIIYHVKRMYFFAYQGFVMYSFDCKADDFNHFKVMRAIEFSNGSWYEKQNF